MAAFLENLGFGKLHNVVAYGAAIAIALAFATGLRFDAAGWALLVRWLHVLSGVMWIGLLWYFNFVQSLSMPRIPEAQRPAVTNIIAPMALFWFRWAALSSVVTGLILAQLNGYLVDALLVGTQGGGGKATAIGLGIWMALIMAYNVWMVIWPNQKKALGLAAATPAERKAAAKNGAIASRFNTMLSIPMLYCMVAAQNLF